jgi:hypothetical protein
MAHIPINHPLRPLYRVLAGLTGLYLLAFGVLGFVSSSGLDPFARSGTDFVLGMRANPAFSVVAALVGLALLVGVVVGRNLYYLVSFGAGVLLMVVGVAMLAVIQTGANILGFSISNVVITMTLGMLVLTAALYGKTDDGAARAEPARTPAEPARSR